MAIYAIGDVQGCYQPLQCLLEKIQFNPIHDTLWFVGDLVNRGPDSLAVLRFIKSLGGAAITVLGNHDLHLLAIANGKQKLKKKDTLSDILCASDRDELLDWLRHQPLLHYDEKVDHVLVHAGIPPQWDLQCALHLAREVEQVLQSDHNYPRYLAAMYGNEPNLWSDQLVGEERLRAITNYFTRMRFCDPRGKLELLCKHSPSHAPTGYAPWFSHPQRKTAHHKIIFGHWATLEGKADATNVFALDTGCVWGKYLTAMRLSDHKTFSCAG